MTGFLDASRQWVTRTAPISEHHAWRYMIAVGLASGRILDAACGTGYGSFLLHKVSQQVVGVDKDQDAIDWAKRNFAGPTFVQGDIEDSPWEGEFETVVSLETIEHIKEPDKALKAFRRACVGRFIASVPNEDLYPFKAENFATDSSPHYRHYTPAEFESLLNGHGFNVLRRFCQVSKLDPEPIEGTNGKFLIYVCV